MLHCLLRTLGLVSFLELFSCFLHCFVFLFFPILVSHGSIYLRVDNNFQFRQELLAFVVEQDVLNEESFGILLISGLVSVRSTFGPLFFLWLNWNMTCYCQIPTFHSPLSFYITC